MCSAKLVILQPSHFHFHNITEWQAQAVTYSTGKEVIVSLRNVASSALKVSICSVLVGILLKTTVRVSFCLIFTAYSNLPYTHWVHPEVIGSIHMSLILDDLENNFWISPFPYCKKSWISKYAKTLGHVNQYILNCHCPSENIAMDWLELFFVKKTDWFCFFVEKTVLSFAWKITISVK